MEKETELQDRIIRKIYEDNKCTTHFEFDDNHRIAKGTSVSQTRLEVSTYNPQHGQKFLLGVFTGPSRFSCLSDALEQLEGGESNFTITWKNLDSSIQNSYFRASNMIQALQKFYHDREMDGPVTVFECKLNPIS